MLYAGSSGPLFFYQWMTLNIFETLAPLHKLVGVSRKDERNYRCTVVHDQAEKHKITIIMKMIPLDHDQKSIVCTDSSNVAVGASPNRNNIDGNLRPITFSQGN